MKSKTITIKHPIPCLIKVNDDKTEEWGTTNTITLGRIKAKHLRLLPSDFTARQGQLEAHEILPLLAGITGLSETSIDEIDVEEDLEEIIEALMIFLGESPVTGKNSSGG